MNFNRNQNKSVVALLGAGSMGCAIVKRIGANKTILLGDISEKNLEERAKEFRMKSTYSSSYFLGRCPGENQHNQSRRDCHTIGV